MLRLTLHTLFYDVFETLIDGLQETFVLLNCSDLLKSSF